MTARMTPADISSLVELKPCPFCGSCEVELRESASDEMIACCNCGARTGLIYLGASDAANAAKRRELVAAWNTRLTPKESALIKPPREYEVSGDAVGGGEAAFDPARVGLGLYKVHWLSGGASLASVYMASDGTRMIAPTNWVAPGKLGGDGWGAVAKLERIDPPADDCPTCRGEGEIEHPFLPGAYGGSHAIDPPDPVMVECEDCGGTGKVEDDE